MLWDNFVKTHIVCDPLAGNPHSLANEVLNRTLIGVPSSKRCLRCQNICSCGWKVDIKPHKVDFKEIFPSGQEKTAKHMFSDSQLSSAIIETSAMLDLLTTITEGNTVMEFPEQMTDHAKHAAEEEHTHEGVQITLNASSMNETSLEDLKNALKTRPESRRQAIDVMIDEQDEGIRLTLKALVGKDTDWSITREIIREATELCNPSEDPDFRLFVGGDQKTMGLVLRMKKQWPEEFKHVYVSTPDLHLRKCMLHAVLKRYGQLGLAHLAFLAGYKTPDQWKYLEDISSISKSFAFAERLFYALQLSFCYEFLKSLDPTEKNYVISFIESTPHKISENPHYQNFIKSGNEDLIWKKNYELLKHLENIIGHYIGERSRNYDLQMACVKDFIPFSVTSNCTSYGPLLIDLIYHQATFQPRYKDLMRRYFSYPLNESKSDIVYVGWDAIAEDTNLKCGQFRHKRQSLGQSAIQSQIVDTMNQELSNMEKNLSFKESSNNRSIKDDRDIKTRLMVAMINFKSFKIKKYRSLSNEFAAETFIFNEGILKENWLPTAEFLIHRYIMASKDQPICDFKTMPALVKNQDLAPCASEMLKKAEKNKSTIIDIKPKQKEENSAKVLTENVIKRKTKAFQDDLLWQNSSFCEAAAICHHDGSKVYPSKAKFRGTIMKHFSNVKTNQTERPGCTLTVKQNPKIVANVKEKCILGENKTEWINDAQLANAVSLLKPKSSTVYCQLMYPLPMSLVEKMMRGERRSKTFLDIFEKKKSCVIPFTDGQHWRVFLIDARQNTVYHFDSLGGSIPDSLKQPMTEIFTSVWKIRDIKKYTKQIAINVGSGSILQSGVS